MVGMLIMIYFKQYSSNYKFGLFLLAFTLFYCINFHAGWIDTQHTKAILAYTFFIWLGFQFHRYWQSVLGILSQIKWMFLIPALIILFGAACYEGLILARAGVDDPYASNRISNILFSIVFFFSLLKMGAVRKINNLQPQRIVYGIYLVNSIVIFQLAILLGEYLKGLTKVDIWTLLILQLIYFTVVLYLTYKTVNYLANSRLRWLIGVKK
jgi:hypothetical protein